MGEYDNFILKIGALILEITYVQMAIIYIVVGIIMLVISLWLSTYYQWSLFVALLGMLGIVTSSVGIGAILFKYKKI